MPIVPPPPGGEGPGNMRVIELRPPKIPALVLVLALGLALVALGVGYWWFVQRVEVEAGQVLVLMKRTGATLKSVDQEGNLLPEHLRDQVVLYPALREELAQIDGYERSYKGIVYEPKPEGRYFYDPFLWKRMVFPAVVIDQDECGVLIRKYGGALQAGKIVATEAERAWSAGRSVVARSLQHQPAGVRYQACAADRDRGRSCWRDHATARQNA
jgi:hypothetical protein